MKNTNVTRDANKETPSDEDTLLKITELKDNTIEEKRLKLALDTRKL